MLTACSQSGSSSTPAPLSGAHISRAHFEAIEHATNVWPLTANSGTLSCIEVRQRGQRAFAVVFTTEDGSQYALKIYSPGVYKEIPTTSATWLIGYGLDLCPHYRPEKWLRRS
jgi:hypothetical protein